MKGHQFCREGYFYTITRSVKVADCAERVPRHWSGLFLEEIINKEGSMNYCSCRSPPRCFHTVGLR